MMLFGRLFLVSSLLFLGACTGSSSNEQSQVPVDEQSPGTRSFVTECGTVVAGGTQNPVEESDGVVTEIIDIISGNTVIVSRTTGLQVIKLAGIADPSNGFYDARSRALIASLSGPALLYESSPGCTAPVPGGTGTVGTIFANGTGESINEKLLLEGAAQAESGAACGSEAVRSCYQALAEENQIEPGATVTNFVWKPRSERDGNLVVLFNPRADTVLANGEQLVFSGASNGRSTTVRAGKQGAAFGANVRLEAYDSLGRPLVFPGGELFLIIPNGANRLEF